MTRSRYSVPLEQLSQETRRLFEVLNNESGLACVVIGSAFLETALGTLLARRFIKSSVGDKLLALSGVLGTFAPRADLAYCLGLISKDHYQDLCVVAEIRNQFAHSHLQLTFKDVNIRQRCNRLNEWRVIFHEDAGELPTDLNETQIARRARNQFNMSVAFLANWVLIDALSIKSTTA